MCAGKSDAGAANVGVSPLASQVVIIIIIIIIIIIYLLQLGCHPVAVVILHVNKP